MLDFQKKIVGPAGPQVFIFCRQNKYSGHQKLYSRINGFSFLKDNRFISVRFPKKESHLSWGPGKQPGMKIWSPLCKSWSHWRPHRSQRRALHILMPANGNKNLLMTDEILLTVDKEDQT